MDARKRLFGGRPGRRTGADDLREKTACIGARDGGSAFHGCAVPGVRGWLGRECETRMTTTKSGSSGRWTRGRVIPGPLARRIRQSAKRPEPIFAASAITAEFARADAGHRGLILEASTAAASRTLDASSLHRPRRARQRPAPAPGELVSSWRPGGVPARRAARSRGRPPRATSPRPGSPRCRTLGGSPPSTPRRSSGRRGSA